MAGRLGLAEALVTGSMLMSGSPFGTIVVTIPDRGAVGIRADASLLPDWRSLNAEGRTLSEVNAQLLASLAREAALSRDIRDLGQRQVMLAEEFEHRLINGLQLVSSLLTLQSRAAASPDAAAQLNIASQRVSALGRVHRRLHVLDHEDRVQFKPYLQQLCDDLSKLLCEDTGDCAILVESAAVEIPTSFAIPLGFVINELITNAAKYASGTITVKFETSPAGHALSVTDEGPGLRPGFKPSDSKGLGMKIVTALVKQIGGALQVGSGAGGRGTRMVVRFGGPAGTPATNGHGRGATPTNGNSSGS